MSESEERDVCPQCGAREFGPCRRDHREPDCAMETRPAIFAEYETELASLRSALASATARVKELEAERDTAVAAEREACARVADERVAYCEGKLPALRKRGAETSLVIFETALDEARAFAAAIRARSEEK